MGGGFYNMAERVSRSATLSYASVTTDDNAFRSTFQQQDKGEAHESMRSKNMTVRVADDSKDHAQPLPIILALDVTASMGNLPKQLVAEGLPKLMEKLLQIGVDPAVCFTAIGDHECDKFPFQVGQFEAGDAELDMWLTRTYLEGGGGANAGESYLLAYYFAAFLTKTSAFDKRGQKGLIFTFGDEPTLKMLPKSAIKEVFGESNGSEKSYTVEELLKLASEKYHIFHINIRHGWRDNTSMQLGWRDLLGQNAIDVKGFEAVVPAIVDAVKSVYPSFKSKGAETSTTQEQKPTEEIRPNNDVNITL